LIAASENIKIATIDTSPLPKKKEDWSAFSVGSLTSEA
jgi:hypothetical protein